MPRMEALESEVTTGPGEGRRSPRGAARSGSLPLIAWSESSGTADRNLESCGSSPLPYQARSRVEPPRSAKVHVYCIWIGTHQCLAAGVVRSGESPFFPLAHWSDTPTRATARARKEPTGSLPSWLMSDSQ